MAEKTTPTTIDLNALCAELKIPPRIARARLRGTVADRNLFPNLAQSHKPGLAWKWSMGSKALQEARKVLGDKETSKAS